MARRLIGYLLIATALGTTTAASAQDVDQNGRRMSRGTSPYSPPAEGTIRTWRGDGAANGGEGMRAAPQAAPAPFAPPAARDSGGWRGQAGGAPSPEWQGRDRQAETRTNPGWQGGGAGWRNRPDAVPAPVPQANAQPPVERRWRNDGQPDGNQRGWNGQRNWNSGDNRWAGQRRDDWRQNDWRRDDRRRDDVRRDDHRWGGNGLSGRWAGQPRWDRDWRHDDRYDWQRYRSYNRDAYRLGRYSPPRGWDYGYRSFSVGIYLQPVLLSDRYWIDDPWSYRLPQAYGTLRWIRYYDDALLVDMRDGYVVDVIRSFFW